MPFFLTGLDSTLEYGSSKISEAKFSLTNETDFVVDTTTPKRNCNTNENLIYRG